jgi:hypothetical protein
VVFSREYQDGQVVTDVQTDPFSVQLRTLEDAAGNYELLLNDSNGLVGDGATHRGLVVATVNRTGSVSGRVLYTEAAPLAGAPGTERTYTSVTRSFSAVFSPSESNLSKLVCAPRIGLGAQANRQELELELDFSTPLVELNATVRDRISVAAETDGEACISQGVGAVRGFTKLAGNFSSLEGRYVLGTGIGYSQSSGPNAENNAAMLVQVLSTGRVLWASRLTGATGTGSANLSTDDDLEAKAQFYEGRTLSSTTVHSTSSLFGELRFRSDITGGSWSAFVGSAAGEGLLERQSCYISKVAKAPVYDAARFDVSMAGDPSYNWSGVSLLSFRDGTSCRWTGATNAGLQAFLNPEGASASSPIPLLYLSAEDPDSEGTYLWTLAVSNTGTVKTANYSLTDSQPVLTMRLDRIRGEWSGSYVSPLTKKRRTLVGVLTRPASGGSLRGAGWVELGVLPSTLSSGWEIDLDPPGK